MYEKFFHLKKRPFSIAPDPGFLYLSDRHRDALAHLKYGLESDGGFVLVTGEVGTGKTTLLRNIIGQVPGNIDVAFILNPRLTVRELLQTICDELAIEHPTEDQHSVKPYIDRLNIHLLKTHLSGRSTVVVIDEAQNLSPAVLEQLRLLTNLETNERKLLRIILVGQPELRTMLGRQELRNLSQRITARYHLEPLKLADTRAYLSHRIRISRGDSESSSPEIFNPDLFSPAASWNIHRHAGGIPRLINIIADRAMLGAYSAGKSQIDFMTSQNAAIETRSESKNILSWLAVAGVLALAAVGGWWLLSTTPQGAPTTQTQSPAAGGEIARSNPPQSPQTRASASDQSNQQQSLQQAPRQQVAANQRTTASPLTSASTGTTAPSVNRIASGTDAQAQTSGQQLPQPVEGVASFRSQRLAFATMFDLWGIVYNPSDPSVPCDYAPRYQLQCTKRRTNWEGLSRLNVPVVMQLTSVAGRVFYATAISADNGRVSLDQGGRSSTVEIDALQKIWDGTIFAFWPTPRIYRGPLTIGSSGQAVQELRELLGNALDRNLGDSRNFDNELNQLLLEFQAANGLARDGIAGPATWLFLHRAAGYKIPELLS